MTQLIIEGTVLPEVSKDNYKCYPEKLEVQEEMISGRLVSEIRGTVQKIEYSFDKMPDATYLALLAALRGKSSITVTYLPDDSMTMVTSSFKVITYPTPGFAFSLGGKPRWHNIAFSLREVKPHD